MKKPLIALILALACSFAWAADKVPAHPHILVETTGQQRGRVYAFDRYISLFLS